MERIMSEQTAEVMEEFMRNNVVLNYGADNFPDLTVCAKSGTGQVGGGLRDNATFAGFVADEEYPLAFIVVVENAGYGKFVCVPILSKVLSVCREVMKPA
jgi:peptidoglycan glycosyltransferase